jgi:quercetin dioxygenase-like cupin family protein
MLQNAATLEWNRTHRQQRESSSMATPAQATVYIDNERTRVTAWRFAPEAATGYHRHAYDYVVVPLTTGTLKLIGPDGSETLAELTTGTPYFRHAGVEHDVINVNAYEFVFVDIEFK